MIYLICNKDEFWSYLREPNLFIDAYHKQNKALFKWAQPGLFSHDKYCINLTIK